MSPELPLEQFILEPDTVDYLVRINSALLATMLEEKPNMRLGAQLTGGYTIVYGKESGIQSLYQEFGVLAASASSSVLGLLDLHSLESAGIPPVQNAPFLDLRGQGVLVGFVDTGIDYTNPSFLYEDGRSKIQYLWDQSTAGNAPDDFAFGSEYKKAQIDEALYSNDPLAIVPQQDTVGHGTFLASVAAGRQTAQNIGAAPDAELIVVKLVRAKPYYYDNYLIPPAQENAYTSNSVAQGIEYISRRAQALGRPVAICLGVGTNLGGHDGFSQFEEYINTISSQRGFCICASAGNESQSRHHAQGILSRTDESSDVDIRVGERGGDIYLSIWNNESDRVSVSLRSPTGERIRQIPAKPGALYQTGLVFERSLITVQYLFPIERSGAQLTIVKIRNATPGIWTVTLLGDIVLNGTYNMWLPITGFIQPGIEFLVPSPNCTIVVPATTIGTITSGAYNSLNNGLYISSSWGPTRLPMMSPDLVAPGVNVGGEYPGGFGTMTGTSVAAAITTGAAALMLQWGIVNQNDVSLDTYRIKSFFIRGCIRSPGVTYPNVQWGYGRLNLFNTLNLMRET